VYANATCDKKNVIISENYLNRMISFTQQLKSYLNDADVGSEDDQLDYVVECCEFVIAKISEKKNTEMICCDAPMALNGTPIAVCLECGKQHIASQRRTRAEKPSSRNKNATYAAMKHFDACFKNIFVGQQEHIDQEILDQIRTFMIRDRKMRITIDDTRQYLKQIGTNGPRYNRLDAQIMQLLNGDRQLCLSNKEYNFIKEFYLSIITVFYEINRKRNNTPNCPFFIKKIINLLYSGLDDQKRQICNKLIFVQKENTVSKINKIWINICKFLDTD